MKHATAKVLESFPILKDEIPNSDSILIEERTLEKLNNTEQVFLKLIWFFENPSKNHFNLYDLLKYIDQSWLSFSLECIVTFFYKDTYLDGKPDFSIINEDTEYMNQTNFVDFLNENKEKHDKNFSRAMLNSYLSRETIPLPDIELSGNKYWLKETCEEYLNSIAIHPKGSKQD